MSKSLDKILLEYGTINRKNADDHLSEVADFALNNNWEFIDGIVSRTKPIIFNKLCQVAIGKDALYYNCLPDQCTKAGYVLAVEHIFHEQRHTIQLTTESCHVPENFQTQSSRDMTNAIRRHFISIFYPFAYRTNYEYDPTEMDAEDYALEQTRALFQDDEFVTSKEADQILYDLMLYFHPIALSPREQTSIEDIQVTFHNRKRTAVYELYDIAPKQTIADFSKFPIEDSIDLTDKFLNNPKFETHRKAFYEASDGRMQDKILEQTILLEYPDACRLIPRLEPELINCMEQMNQRIFTRNKVIPERRIQYARNPNANNEDLFTEKEIESFEEAVNSLSKTEGLSL